MLSARTGAQTNGGFEDWTLFNGKYYPNTWQIGDSSEFKNGIVLRSTDAASGNYSIRFNSNPLEVSSYVELGGSFFGSQRPNQLEFMIKTDKIYNTFLDGGYVTIYLYDSLFNYVDDINIDVTQNTKSWVKYTQGLNLKGIKYYLIEIGLFDATKNGGTYAMFDDFMFSTKPVSVLEQQAETIQIYPNPSSSFFKISSSKDIRSVTIWNNVGQMVKVYNVSQSSTFDISDLPIGLYLIKIESKEGVVFIKHITKQ